MASFVKYMRIGIIAALLSSIYGTTLYGGKDGEQEEFFFPEELLVLRQALCMYAVDWKVQTVGQMAYQFMLDQANFDKQKKIPLILKEKLLQCGWPDKAVEETLRSVVEQLECQRHDHHSFVLLPSAFDTMCNVISPVLSPAHQAQLQDPQLRSGICDALTRVSDSSAQWFSMLEDPNFLARWIIGEFHRLTPQGNTAFSQLQKEIILCLHLLRVQIIPVCDAIVSAARQCVKRNTIVPPEATARFLKNIQQCFAKAGSALVLAALASELAASFIESPLEIECLTEGQECFVKIVDRGKKVTASIATAAGAAGAYVGAASGLVAQKCAAGYLTSSTLAALKASESIFAAAPKLIAGLSTTGKLAVMESCGAKTTGFAIEACKTATATVTVANCALVGGVGAALIGGAVAGYYIHRDLSTLNQAVTAVMQISNELATLKIALAALNYFLYQASQCGQIATAFMVEKNMSKQKQQTHEHERQLHEQEKQLRQQREENERLRKEIESIRTKKPGGSRSSADQEIDEMRTKYEQKKEEIVLSQQDREKDRLAFEKQREQDKEEKRLLLQRIEQLERVSHLPTSDDSK